jgi:hypothetical protein
MCEEEIRKDPTFENDSTPREIAKTKYRCDFLEYGERARHHTILWRRALTRKILYVNKTEHTAYTAGVTHWFEAAVVMPL